MTESLADDVALYTVTDGVARIILNRPNSLNAVNGALHAAIVGNLGRAAEDEEVRVVVISGAGRAFSAGGDVKAVAAGDEMGDPSEIALAIWNMPKPVIAAVHGFCLGQAYEFASICDLTIAAESAQFGEVEITRGWPAPILITPYVVSLKHAKQMLLLGETLDAAWALRVGLVNWVVPDDQLEAEVARVTSRIVGLNGAALARNKRAVNQTYELTEFLEALRLGMA